MYLTFSRWRVGSFVFYLSLAATVTLTDLLFHRVPQFICLILHSSFRWVSEERSRDPARGCLQYFCRGDIILTEAWKKDIVQLSWFMIPKHRDISVRRPKTSPRDGDKKMVFYFVSENRRQKLFCHPSLNCSIVFTNHNCPWLLLFISNQFGFIGPSPDLCCFHTLQYHNQVPRETFGYYLIQLPYSF